MAIAVVQTKTANSGDYVESMPLAFDSNITAGNLIVVCIGANGEDITGISDTQTNSWTQVQEGTSGNIRGRMYYAANSKAGATTVTVTFTTWIDAIITMYEISGCATSSPLDVSAENVEAEYLTAHPTGTTGETAQNDEICIGMYTGDDNENYTVGGSWTGLIDTDGSDLYISLVTAHLIVSSTGAQSATFTSTEYLQGYGAIGCFKQASVAGTNMKINIGDVHKDISEMKINIGDSWKDVAGVQVNIGDSWKTVF